MRQAAMVDPDSRGMLAGGFIITTFTLVAHLVDRMVERRLMATTPPVPRYHN